MLERTDTMTRARHRCADDRAPDDRAPERGGLTAVIDVPVVLPAPDWYPDPLSPEHHRWWSGIAWTGYTQRVTSEPPTGIRTDHASETRRQRGRRALPADEAAERAARDALGEVIEPESGGGGVVTVRPGDDPDLDLRLDRVRDPVLDPVSEVEPTRAAPAAARLRDDPLPASIRTAARAAVAVQRYVPPPPAANMHGRAAIVLAIAGIVAGVGVVVWPILLPISVLLLVVAIVVALWSLPKWGRRRRIALVGLALGVAGLAVGPIVLGPVGVRQILSGDLQPMGIDVSLAGQRSAEIGEQVVFGDGIAVTVQSVECGVTRATTASGAVVAAAGEYCVVRASILNGSELPIVVRAEDVEVSIDGVDVPASAATSDLGGAVSPTSVDPATGIEASFVVDVPTGSSAADIKLDAAWTGGPTLRVAAAG